MNLDYSDSRDVLYAGAGMDAPKDKLKAWKLAHEAELGSVALRASIGSAEVEHLMDNYSLRAQTGMLMRVPATADTRSLELAADIGLHDWNLELGLQQAQLDRLAIRSAGTDAANLNMRNALLWPQVELQRRGVFAEARGPLSTATTLTAGIRFDRFEAAARRANERVNMGLAAPAEFYRSNYGASADRFTDDGAGALLRLEHALGQGVQLFGGLSRSVRAADSTERYIASTSGTGPSRWIGNPLLANEVHQQVDAGLVWKGAAARYSLDAHLDRIDHDILRDRARAAVNPTR